MDLLNKFNGDRQRAFKYFPVQQQKQDSWESSVSLVLVWTTGEDRFYEIKTGLKFRSPAQFPVDKTELLYDQQEGNLVCVQ